MKDMDFTLVNEGKSTILLYRCENVLKEELARINTHYNSIFGLIPFIPEEHDNGWELSYHVKSKTSIETYFNEGLTKDKIVTNFINIINHITYLQENGVDVNRLVINEQYIYLDHHQPYFIYVPIQIDTFETTTLSQFFQRIFSTFPYDEEDDPVFFVKLHNYLIQFQESRGMTALKEKLMKLGGIDVPPNDTPLQDFEGNSQFYSPTNYLVQDQSSVEGGEETGKKSFLSYTDNTQCGNVPSSDSMSLQEIYAKEGREETKGTTVLGTFDKEEEAGTTTLDDISYVPHLLLLSTNERIKVTKSTFTIGRDPNNTDYTLYNKVIGRVHAKILSSDGTYYIKDNNSRNGTYVNGVKLQPMERVKMKHEDKIKLANEELEFRIF